MTIITAEEYVVFWNVPINRQAIDDFVRHVLHSVPNGRRIHLMLNSQGGTLTGTLALARFVSSLPCTLITYNMERVNSAAIVLFAAGAKRVALSTATFFSHSVAISLNGTFTPKTLKVEYDNLCSDYEKSVTYLKDRTKRSLQDWRLWMSEEGHLFSAEEALNIGLVTTVVDNIEISTEAAVYYVSDKE